MTSYVGSKLILVEGLTGSGKSIMAHMIARQLRHNGISATWIHEGELPHPLGIEDDPGSNLARLFFCLPIFLRSCALHDPLAFHRAHADCPSVLTAEGGVAGVKHVDALGHEQDDLKRVARAGKHPGLVLREPGQYL